MFVAIFLILLLFAIISSINWYKYGYISKAVKIDKKGFEVKFLNDKHQRVEWGEIEEFIEHPHSVLDRNIFVFYRPKKERVIFLEKIHRTIPLQGNRTTVILPEIIGKDIFDRWKKYLEEGGSYSRKNRIKDLIKANKRMIIVGTILAIGSFLTILFLPWNQLSLGLGTFGPVALLLSIAGVIFAMVIAILGWAAKDQNIELLEKIEKHEENPPTEME